MSKGWSVVSLLESLAFRASIDTSSDAAPGPLNVDGEPMRPPFVDC